MRITLDTNQFIRALMRPPDLATFVMAWQARRFIVVCSLPLLEEYILVMEYAEIAPLLYPELRRIFFDLLIHEMELVELYDIPRVCRDPDDDKVVATALSNNVNYLITDDDDLRTTSINALLADYGVELATIDELITMLD